MQTKYRASTRSALAAQYNISLPTFRKWLVKIPNLDLADNQRTFTPKQVEMIMIHLGEPPD